MSEKSIELPVGDAAGLRRTVGPVLLVLYGVGTIVGAGIYALIGEVAGRAGQNAPWAFLLAALMAAASALSFAELSARFPKSAGEAEYVSAAFGSRRLSLLVGLLVMLVGIVSAATVANGFAGYARDVLPLSRDALILGFIVGVAAVAAWGVRESFLVAAGITIAEMAGLLLVIGYAVSYDPVVFAVAERAPASVTVAPLFGIMSGALLAFYAYVGFEDMVNVAEEVRDPVRTMPIAIVVTLVTTTAIYLVLAVVAVKVVPPQELASSSAPLRMVYERAGGFEPRILSVLGVVAMINGALVQILMASRVAYGLGGHGSVAAWAGAVNARTRTPVRATIIAAAGAGLLALRFPIATLAEATSLVTLGVFAVVNLALIAVKSRDVAGGQPTFTVPALVPWSGLVTSVLALVYAIASQVVHLPR